MLLRDNIQLDVFSVHEHENNHVSQSHLDANREHFAGKCLTVYEWLMFGHNLTVLWAANNKVSSLPRRLKDLKDKGMLISEKWDEGVKIWFLTPEQRQYNLKFKK